jgi:hypothetical protein
MPLTPFCPALRKPHDDLTFCVQCGPSSPKPPSKPSSSLQAGAAAMPIEVEDSLAPMRTNPSHAKGYIAESTRDIANKRQQEREALKAKPSGFYASALVALVHNKAKSIELD